MTTNDTIEKPTSYSIAMHKKLVELNVLRSKIRSGKYKDSTSGLIPGLLQCNLAILPASFAEDFLKFCQLNPVPCPVVGYSKPGDPSLPMLGDDIDIRVDVPEYHIFIDGQFSRSQTDIKAYWKKDSVAILLGCSFSFEDALQAEGFSIRNIECGKNVSMYKTNIPLKQTEYFSCGMVVSMRPFKQHQIDDVARITGRFTHAHGKPVHIGDPEAIGINDIYKPDYGEAIPLEDDDIPVFWGCGVTSQVALREAKLPLVVTHAPGKMLVTDLTYEMLNDR